MNKVLKALLPIVIAILIVIIPPPSGLSLNGWIYLAIFIGVIVALITEPLPAAAVGLIGVVIAAASGIVYAEPKPAIKWALSGFSNHVVWLIFVAFLFAEGYSKTGLGRRIALHIIRWIGRKTIGLGYAVALSDLVLAPFMPSNTARSAGTIFPIIRNIPEVYGSHPGETAGKLGTYIMWTAFATTCVTSSWFLTGLAPNPLAATFVQQVLGIEISWAQWFIGFLPVGIILFLLVPVITYFLASPEIKSSPKAAEWAKEELSKMGGITKQEITFLILVLMALALWIGGRKYLDSALVGLLVVVLALIFGILNWRDVLEYKQAWNVLVWFATLVTLAGGLKTVGVVKYISQSVPPLVSGLNPVITVVALVIIFYFIHYMFASITTCIFSHYSRLTRSKHHGQRFFINIFSWTIRNTDTIRYRACTSLL
jgi:L-tartrate/succinate antiporter